MEIGKVIKLRNSNLVRWNRKHDIGFTTTLFSFYRIMKITRWLKFNRKLSRRKKEKKTEKLEILALKCLIKSGRVKCKTHILKTIVLGATHGHCVQLYPLILKLMI